RLGSPTGQRNPASPTDLLAPHCLQPCSESAGPLAEGQIHSCLTFAETAYHQEGMILLHHGAHFSASSIIRLHPATRGFDNGCYTQQGGEDVTECSAIRLLP